MLQTHNQPNLTQRTAILATRSISLRQSWHPSSAVAVVAVSPPLPPPACTRRVTDLLVLLAPDIGKKKRARAALDAGVPLPAHAPVREPVRHLLLAQVVPHRALFVEFQIIAPGCANAMRMHNLRTTSCTTSQAGMRGTPGPAPAAGGALRFTSAHSLLPALRHVHRDRGVPREFHALGCSASTRSPGGHLGAFSPSASAPMPRANRGHRGRHCTPNSCAAGLFSPHGDRTTARRNCAAR